MLTKNEMSSLVDMQKDIIAHPLEKYEENDYLSDIFDSEVFSQAEIEDINSALKIILGSASNETEQYNLMENLWKVNYRIKPPTAEELLTPEWIGPTADSLFPHVKEAIIKFFDPTKPYRNLVEYWPIGSGKSLTVALIKIFLAIHDYYLRDQKKFFKLAPTTHIVDVTVSLSLDMAFDLNIRPLLLVLETSPKFRKARLEEQLLKRIREEPDTIHFTTATKGNSILRIGDLNYHAISEPAQLLGLSVQTASLTELAFLHEKGMKQETVMRLLNDTKGRIYSRFGNHYLARSIVDSSPNDLNNLVDRYIYYDCEKDPTVLKLSGRKWELQPHLFPTWEKTKETFKMFRGNASNPPKLIEDEVELQKIDINEIEYIPIDIKQLAIDAPTKVVKDYCGFPSGMDSKLISNHDMIEGIFTPSIKNIYTFHNAPSSLPPEGLLWNIIKKAGFFIPTGQGNQYQFYRCPNAERFLAVDLAKKFDMACISMCHLEKNLKGERIFVIDFCLPIMSTKEEINMESFQWLAYDMKRFGGIKIKAMSYDGYQSDTSRQFLNRHEIDCYYQSMDKTVEPYMNFISAMAQKRIVMGRNIIMKNNLKSLIMRKEDGKRYKVEHEEGSWIDLENLKWETSRMGYYGKDVSDSVVASVTLANLHGTDSADYVYNEKEELDKKDGMSLDSLGKELSSKLNFKMTDIRV